MKTYYDLLTFKEDASNLARSIMQCGRTYSNIYGVPQGGIPLAIELSHLTKIPLTSTPNGLPISGEEYHTLVVDDIIDSGRTRKKYTDWDFACLHIKNHAKLDSSRSTYFLYDDIEDWIVYWWEGNEEKSITDSITRQLEYIGENPNREGLIETPERVVKSWNYIFSGYGQRPENIIKTFDADGYDEMIILKDIEMYSMCEHHLLPFIGKAHIAYIPDKKIIGVSKLARILEMYSRRAQIQERIGDQVTSCIMKHLNPKGVACVIEAQHLCMQMRGIQKQNSVMVTSSLKGVFLDKPAAREELMRLIK